MELSLITNDVRIALDAEKSGVERIFIDLERRGKALRQRGRDLFLSTHTLSDVERIRQVLSRAKLMVRIDPPHDRTPEQVDRVIELGADYVMLPYFRLVSEAVSFTHQVGIRANPVLLVERAEAVHSLKDFCQLPGLGEIHIGLNDLSGTMGFSHWFQVLGTDVLHEACSTMRKAGIAFGFGGIGSLSRKDLPLSPELVLAEQVGQGATRGWLSRAFRDVAERNMRREVEQLRKAIDYWRSAGAFERESAQRSLQTQLATLRGVQPTPVSP